MTTALTAAGIRVDYDEPGTTLPEERDLVIANAQGALERAKEMELQIALMEDQNDQIFRQLEPIQYRMQRLHS